MHAVLKYIPTVGRRAYTIFDILGNLWINSLLCPSLGQVQGGPGMAEGYWLLCVGHTWAGASWKEQDAVQWGEDLLSS